MMRLVLSGQGNKILGHADDSMVYMSIFDQSIIKTSTKNGSSVTESIPYTHLLISNIIK